MTPFGRVVISGAPGVGKTALLNELAGMGCATVAESARAVIRERLARGEPPRPAPADFAREILRRDVEKYRAAEPAAGWVFFDRGVVEALAMLHEAAPLPLEEHQSLIAACRYHPVVFVPPPWREIYVNDAERDQSFEHALAVHAALLRCYRDAGYEICDVPRATPAERAAYVLRVLGR